MNSVFCFDAFELDCRAFALRHDGTTVRVDTVVLRLLETLVRRSGQLVTKGQLITDVWGGRPVTDNSLTVAMTRLRKIFRDHGLPRDSVVTVHAQGYRFNRRVSTSGPEALQPSAAELVGSAFVGREQVISRLKAALVGAQNRCGSLVVLRGEPGTGKTRVAEVFAEQALRAGCAVTWASCHEHTALPTLWPFVELLRGVLSHNRSSEGSAIVHAVPPELSPLLPDVLLGAEQVDATDPTAKHRVFDAVACALAKAAEATPLVLILDDLQRADQASLELLCFILAGIARTHILVLATLRIGYGDELTNRPLTTALSHRNCVRVAIEPLSQNDVARYMAFYFATVERGLSQRVYELSEGNPFCMAELVQQLRHRNGADAVELAIPRSARELVRQRLTAVTEDALDVLTYAAVIGTEFGLPLLAAATERNASSVIAVLDDACSAGIVRAVVDSGTEFRFVQRLLRAVLYEELSAGERRLRHLRVAHALELRHTLGELPYAELAFHARAALPRGDLRKTVEYCVAAANTAERKHALSEAIHLLKDAREALELDRRREPDRAFSAAPPARDACARSCSARLSAAGSGAVAVRSQPRRERARRGELVLGSVPGLCALARHAQRAERRAHRFACRLAELASGAARTACDQCAAGARGCLQLRADRARADASATLAGANGLLERTLVRALSVRRTAAHRARCSRFARVVAVAQRSIDRSSRHDAGGPASCAYCAATRRYCGGLAGARSLGAACWRSGQRAALALGAHARAHADQLGRSRGWLQRVASAPSQGGLLRRERWDGAVVLVRPARLARAISAWRRNQRGARSRSR